MKQSSHIREEGVVDFSPYFFEDKPSQNEEVFKKKKYRKLRPMRRFGYLRTRIQRDLIEPCCGCKPPTRAKEK